MVFWLALGFVRFQEMFHYMRPKRKSFPISLNSVFDDLLLLCYLLGRQSTRIEPARIGIVRRIIEDVAVELGVSGSEASRILLQPGAGRRIVHAEEREHEPRVAILNEPRIGVAPGVRR